MYSNDFKPRPHIGYRWLLEYFFSITITMNKGCIYVNIKSNVLSRPKRNRVTIWYNTFSSGKSIVSHITMIRHPPVLHQIACGMKLTNQLAPAPCLSQGNTVRHICRSGKHCSYLLNFINLEGKLPASDLIWTHFISKVILLHIFQTLKNGTPTQSNTPY